MILKMHNIRVSKKNDSYEFIEKGIELKAQQDARTTWTLAPQSLKCNLSTFVLTNVTALLVKQQTVYLVLPSISNVIYVIDKPGDLA